MSKTWLIARHHFGQETSKRSFLLVLFSLPLFLIFTIGMGYVFARMDDDSVTLGVVDQAHLLVDTALQTKKNDVQLIFFETPETARAALEAEQVDAYYVIAADYADTGRAELVYFESPSYKGVRHFENIVRFNLMADQPPAVVNRLLSGANVTVRAIESKRDFPADGPGVGHFVPLIAAAMFVFLVLTTSGYMMEVVVTEKENRTMEIVLTSVSPAQMMTGKITGALGIALLQLLVWVTFFAGAVWLGGSILEIGWLQNIEFNWRDVLMVVVVALPAYLFLAALMTVVGATLVEDQEAQQAGGLFFLPLFLPIYLMVPITRALNGPLSLGLSFFPITSVMTIGIRSIFMEIPVWQIATSAVISLASGVAAVWLTGKAFRMSMLRYGKRLRWRELLKSR